MTTERYYQKCLREDLAVRLAKNPRYSLRSYARSLKIDASVLSRILSGKKIPTPELSRRLMASLALTAQQEREFLQSMAAAYGDEGVKRKKPEVHRLLAEKSVAVPQRDLSPEVFRIISDWYHFAILQLVETESFRANERWIARQLSIPEVEVKLAVARLFELGFLEVREGRWVRATERLATGDLQLTTVAHRKRIRQIHELSLRALESDPIDVRNHTTLTIGIDPDRLVQAKERIQTFMDELAALLGPKKKQVYELQINLFPLQPKKPALSPRKGKSP